MVSRPQADNGRVFFAMAAGDNPREWTAVVHGIDASSGESLWVFETEYSFESFRTLVVGNGLVYGSAGERLFGIDQETGRANWSVKGEFGESDKRLGRFLYLTRGAMFGRHTLVALDPLTGETAWSGPKADNLYIRALIEDVLYLSSGNAADSSARLHAVDAKTGDDLWAMKTGENAIESGPVKSGAHLYFATATNWVWGQDPIPGELRCITLPNGE